LNILNNRNSWGVVPNTIAKNERSMRDDCSRYSNFSILFSNDIHKYFLEKRIEKFEYLEQSSRMERSFLAMVFGTTPQELRINLQTYKNAMSGGFRSKYHC
jgi:hypothetical protein